LQRQTREHPLFPYGTFDSIFNITQRNVSAAEVWFKKEKGRNTKKTSAGNSWPPQSSVTQQSVGAVRIHPSPPHTAISTSLTTPVIATISALHRRPHRALPSRYDRLDVGFVSASGSLFVVQLRNTPTIANNLRVLFKCVFLSHLHALPTAT
jgi:hypothetical protein